MSDSSWIYESPDGGKTIVRRPAMFHSDLNRSILVENDVWWDIRNLKEIGGRLAEEQKLRDRNPTLEDLWQQYQTMKKLLSAD